ncbi:hypothetical protein OI450_05925 [Pectobacterium cacticida]|uniref:Uncharacterized protein n=1 Tax=Pectobacterium cacticida TaxID=69221 RepID=A0ABZ2G9A4_9GAMM|nr:hypothetical protein [Pectobacterium cacticida]UYX07908.1 hypothetical protein OI450_05925 [Pectobacterium cacticida]
MTTESSVTDTILPPLSEAQEDDPFTEEVKAHYAKTSSADVAAKRMGIFDRNESDHELPRRSWQSWIFKSLLAVLFFVPLAACVMFFLIVQQQSVQLDSLDAAFRRGQLQQLPAEMQELKIKIGELRSEFVSVKELDALRQSQNDWASTLDTKLNQYIKNVEGQSAIPERLAHLEQRINDLQGTADAQDKRISSLASDWQNRFEKLVPQKQKATPAKKSQRIIKPMPAPFALTSIEHRGGQQYAVIIPHSAAGNRWSDIRMLTPGESVNGWTLSRIDGNQARFLVNGKPQILTLQ